ncbi:MAG: LacI family DNA-binding transcriptional regulator [Actinomycetes bacterium]
MTTLRDVAAQVGGVSVSTVSRALTGHPHVDEELRSRIQTAARSLDYRPNAHARALRQRQSRTIGLVLPDIVNITYAAGSAVLQRIFQRYGYNVALFVTDNDPAVERDCLQRLSEQQVDGIIHVPCTSSGARMLDRAGDRIPVVELFRHSQGGRFDCVIADDEQSAYQVIEHLATLGHRRIGVIAGDAEFSTTGHRLAGITRALQDFAIDPEHCPVMTGSYSREWGARAFTELLRMPDRPTAVFATSSEFVLGALLATTTQGVRLPDQVSLAGLGDPDWYSVVSAPVTSYSLPLEEMGMAAAQLLVSRISQEPQRGWKPTSLTVAGHFAVRDSTGPPVPAGTP